ncbi:thermonuclease family protein [Brucella pseudintermedia]|uniref:thermonuclease family protein n=1 Tax=Brucella pseudintermedia TaxID=370111 RepID=UPI0030F3D9DE
MFSRRSIAVAALVAGAILAGMQSEVGHVLDQLITTVQAKLPIVGTPLARTAIDSKRVYVYDGDTIIIDRQRMRLVGIDAPEFSEPRCDAERTTGYAARDRLRDLIARSVMIEIADRGERDKYSRPLVRLFVDGRDAGDLLMSEGLAVRWRPGSKTWNERFRHWCGNTSPAS